MTVFSRIIWIIIIGIIGSVFYSHFTKEINENTVEIEQPKWSMHLDHCAGIDNAEPTEDFELCQQAAEDGSLAAQKRVAWAYTQKGEYQDWQAAYDRLSVVAQTDRKVALLRNIILFVLGTSEDDKLRGERAIRALANIQHPGAQAYLASVYQLELNQLPRDANIGWLLENAYDSDKTLISPFEMAIIYANGFGVKANRQNAKAVLDEYAQSDFPVSANNTAWFLATLDDNLITSNDYPLQLAKSVIDEPEYSGRYTYVDTLAATYAATGNFDKAASIQRQAIDLLKAEIVMRPDLNEDMGAFEERLNHYLTNKPLALETLQIPKETFFTNLKNDIEQVLLNHIHVTIKQPPSS